VYFAVGTQENHPDGIDLDDGRDILVIPDLLMGAKQANLPFDTVCRRCYNGPGFTNNPGQGHGSGGTCFGDSGGPLFHGESSVVGAIVSWGITPCIGVDYQFRIDTAVAQDFIGMYLP
jgi:secreted trypsin-like serine protease